MTKLQLPLPQKSLLPREQLLALLDRGLASKVTLIAGPAGYGKTSLVNQWIEARSTHEDFPGLPALLWMKAITIQYSSGATLSQPANNSARALLTMPLHYCLLTSCHHLSRLR